jgi:hypothetical protein
VRAPVVLAILVVGVGSLAVGYALGKEDSSDASPRNPSDRAFSEGGVTKHEYTLHDGDVVFRHEAGARCFASREGVAANLFCTRIGGGRHQIILYKDEVLVWPLDCPACGPGGPVYTYHWAER